MNVKRVFLGIFGLLSTGMAKCVNDGVCTLQEYQEHCPDCVIHNVTYPNVTTVVHSSGYNWVWILGLGILVVVLVGIALAIYFIYHKSRKHHAQRKRSHK